MALCINLYKSQHLISRYVLAVLSGRLVKCSIHSQQDRSIALEADVLDDFTTQLMQKKSNKWEIMRARRKLGSEREQVKCLKKQEKRVKQYLNENELNTLLRDAIEIDNSSCVKEIVDDCISSKTLPILSVLLQTLSFYTRKGDKDAVLSIIKLCGEVDANLMEENYYFKHYLAEATWVKGNINEAIDLFEDVYRNSVYLRRAIRNMLRHLMVDAITNRSEAALRNMISFAERLVEDFRDYYPLACIWQTCFLSEWFTDQCIALDLLAQNEGLCKAVMNQMPLVVALALKNHRTELVYRLLEVLLMLEHKTQYARILEALFDYRVRQGDLRGCSEIIQWSLKQDIALPAIQEEKFVNLFLTHTSDSPQTVNDSIKPKVPSAPGVQFKF